MRGENERVNTAQGEGLDVCAEPMIEGQRASYVFDGECGAVRRRRLHEFIIMHSHRPFVK